MKQIQGKLVLLPVSGEFELWKVRVIGVQLYCHGLRSFDVTLDLRNKTALHICYEQVAEKLRGEH